MKGTEPADCAPESDFEFGHASNLHATQKLEREMELLPVGPAHDTPREGVTQLGLSFFNVIPDFFRHPQSYEYPPLIRNRVVGHLSKGGRPAVMATVLLLRREAAGTIPHASIRVQALLPLVVSFPDWSSR